MGIINATPDSFYTKGAHNTIDGLVQLAGEMIADGATILDIGGASTRPGQLLMPPEEEMPRVLPVVQAIRHTYPDVWISVDTYNSKVAKETVATGADMINDISGGLFDPCMLKTVAALHVPYILMHIQGKPATMQQNPQYQNATTEVHLHLALAIAQCRDAGITDIIADPGFGFGKTVAHNFELLKNLNLFSTLQVPVLAGLSRKSMICKPLHISPAEALNGTTALNMAALMNGAAILRVHDVKEAKETVTLYEYLRASGS
jgi:dihydropteroate synthase